MLGGFGALPYKRWVKNLLHQDECFCAAEDRELFAPQGSRSQAPPTKSKKESD
jgi:hypothetical protein